MKKHLFPHHTTELVTDQDYDNIIKQAQQSTQDTEQFQEFLGYSRDDFVRASTTILNPGYGANAWVALIKHNPKRPFIINNSSGRRYDNWFWGHSSIIVTHAKTGKVLAVLGSLANQWKINDLEHIEYENTHLPMTYGVLSYENGQQYAQEQRYWHDFVFYDNDRKRWFINNIRTVTPLNEECVTDDSIDKAYADYEASMIEDNESIEHETEENTQSSTDNEDTISFTRKRSINKKNLVLQAFIPSGIIVTLLTCVVWIFTATAPEGSHGPMVEPQYITLMFLCLFPILSWVFIFDMHNTSAAEKLLCERDDVSEERYDLLVKLKELDELGIQKNAPVWNDRLFDTAQLVANPDVMIDDCTINVESLKAYALTYKELDELAPTVKY